MNMKQTLWHPSTCSCEITYEWDRDEAEETRRHKIVHVKHCGQNHPLAVVGEQVEGSAFHKDHIKKH